MALSMEGIGTAADISVVTGKDWTSWTAGGGLVRMEWSEMPPFAGLAIYLVAYPNRALIL